MNIIILKIHHLKLIQMNTIIKLINQNNERNKIFKRTNQKVSAR